MVFDGTSDEDPSSRRALRALVGTQGAAFFLLLWGNGWGPERAIRLLAAAALTAAAIWWLPRSGRVARGAALVLMGIAGATAGAGMATAYLSQLGLTPVATAAIVSLVTGLCLIGSGATTLIRALPGWWRLLTLPAVLALVVFVLFPLIVAVNATNRPAGPFAEVSPADRGLPYRDVTFLASDGVRLSGWYVPSRNGAAVVLLHGAGSDRTAVLGQAAAIVRHGYGALLLDTRGHGRSGGVAMDFGWYGTVDVAAAVSFLLRQTDVDAGRIGVLGLSMGGEQAIVAAGSDKRIREVVAEGVTGEQAADHGWLPTGPDGMAQRVIDEVMYGTADLLSGVRRPMSIRDAIAAASPRQVLIIAAGTVPDEAVAGRWFREASPQSVRLWVVPGAGHTGGLSAQPDLWEANVTRFLDAALEPAGA